MELAGEIERLVAIQRRLGILASDVLTHAREWELSYGSALRGLVLALQRLSRGRT